MEAMCPHCFGKGCSECKGIGTISVAIAEGEILTRHCNACGFNNGGRVVSEMYPAPTEKPDRCVKCKSEDMEWKTL